MDEPPRITSLANPRVKRVVKLRKQRERVRRGMFIAEGVREVSRAHAAGLLVECIYTCPPLLEAGGVETDALPPPSEAEHVEVSEAVLKKMAYLRQPEGVLAEVFMPQWGRGHAGGLIGLNHLAPVDASTLLLVAVHTEKPGNLGAMVRTAEAAGCRAVLAAGTLVDAFNPNAIRTSTGAVFRLPTLNLYESQAQRWLVEQGVRVLASSPRGDVLYNEADYSGPIALVIGPEDAGLAESWYDAAASTGGQRVRIPMQGSAADSLNASNAAAVLLFEALRQRQT